MTRQKMTRQMAMRILSGEVIGTNEQYEEALKMGIKALSDSIKIAKFAHAKKSGIEMTPELENYIISVIKE